MTWTLVFWLKRSGNMKAIDTNIVVRFLTGEDHPQTEIARKLVTAETVFVATTVVLETAWVLRSVYGFAQADGIRALRAFAGLPSVALEEPDRTIQALNNADKGMDFADALHFGAADQCGVFLTFDRKFIRAAEGGGVPVVEPFGEN